MHSKIALVTLLITLAYVIKLVIARQGGFCLASIDQEPDGGIKVIRSGTGCETEEETQITLEDVYKQLEQNVMKRKQSQLQLESTQQPDSTFDVISQSSQQMTFDHHRNYDTTSKTDEVQDTTAEELVSTIAKTDGIFTSHMTYNTTAARTSFHITTASETSVSFSLAASSVAQTTSPGWLHDFDAKGSDATSREYSTDAGTTSFDSEVDYTTATEAFIHLITEMTDKPEETASPRGMHIETKKGGETTVGAATFRSTMAQEQYISSSQSSNSVSVTTTLGWQYEVDGSGFDTTAPDNSGLDVVTTAAGWQNEIDGSGFDTTTPDYSGSDAVTTAPGWQYDIDGSGFDTTTPSYSGLDVVTTAAGWQSEIYGSGFDTTTPDYSGSGTTAPGWQDEIDGSGFDTTAPSYSGSGCGVDDSACVESTKAWQNITCEDVWRLKTDCETVSESPPTVTYPNALEDNCEMLYCGICFWSVIELASLYRAQEGCRRYGGRVANIYSEQHLNMTFHNLKQKLSTGYIWTGMAYNVTLRETTLRNGLPAPYTRWSPGQPNNDQSSIFIDLDMSNDGMWNIYPGYPDNGYICELLKCS